MNLDVFAEQIRNARERAERLQSGAGRVDAEHSLTAALAELSTAVEELRVAEEELTAQNEMIAEAHEATELQKHRAEDLFERAPDGYVVTDPLGVVLAANRAAARMLGQAQEALLGKPLAALIPEQELRGFLDRLAGLASERRIEGWRFLTRSNDREAAIYISTNAETGRDPIDGSSIIRWTMRDVTEAKQLEARVREMDHKLWIRVVERTSALTVENERLRAELARLGAGPGPRR